MPSKAQSKTPHHTPISRTNFICCKWVSFENFISHWTVRISVTSVAQMNPRKPFNKMIWHNRAGYNLVIAIMMHTKIWQDNLITKLKLILRPLWHKTIDLPTSRQHATSLTYFFQQISNLIRYTRHLRCVLYNYISLNNNPGHRK